MRLGLLAILLACLLSLAFPQQSYAGGGGENLLMLVNPNNEASLRIANAYAKLRAVPDSNIIFISPSTMAGYPLFSCDYASSFIPVFVNSLANTISSRGIGNQIDYIATFGLPQVVSGNYYNAQSVKCYTVLSLTYALGLLTEFQRGMTGGQVSGTSYPSKDSTDLGAYYRTSELCQVYVPWDQDTSGTNVATADDLPYTRGTNSAIRHSTSYAAVDVAPPGYNYVQWYMAGNTGNSGMYALSTSQVIANLQYTAAGDGTKPAGQYYFDNSGDGTRTGTRWHYWGSVQKYMNAQSISWSQENSVTPHNRTDVRGATFGAAFLTLPNGSTWLPGSYADNLTSNGGCYGTIAQTKDDKMLQTGAGCTAGTMTEPYATQTRFTFATVFIYSAEGSTLGEAHYKAIQVPDFDLLEGDLLSQAYADVPHVVFTAAPANYATVSGLVSISASAALVPPLTTTATSVSYLELFVDGLSKGTKIGATGAFSLSTTLLSDGVHEIRAVGYNNSAAQSQGYVLSHIVVNNQGRSIVAASSSYEISWDQTLPVPVTVTPGTGTVSSLQLLCLGRVVASVTGSSGTPSLTSSNLAFGANTIVPAAVFSDGSQVQGTPVTVTRDFLQPPGVSITPSSLRTPGFNYEYFGNCAGKTIATSSFGGTPTIVQTGTILSLAPATPLNMPDAFRYTMSNTNAGLAVRVTCRMNVVTPGEYSFWFLTGWSNWDSFQLSIDGFPVMGHEFWNGTTFNPLFSWYGICDTTHTIYLPVGEHVIQVLLANYQGSGNDGAAVFPLWYRGPDGVSQQPGTVVQSTSAQFYTVPSYPVTMAASPAVGGSAAVTNSQNNYAYGTPVQIVATPALGYQFVNWSLSGSGSILNATSSTTTLTVDGADTVTANFLAYNLTGTATATGGAIVLTPSGGPYYTGEVVGITASASAGWRFTSWSATGATLSSSTALSTSLTVTTNFNLTALFTEIPYTVTTAAVPPVGGTVAYTPTGMHFINDVLSIQASPAPGYYFVNWTATGATLGTNAASTTATVANNVSLTASFAASSYSGTETVANGTIILSNSGPYTYGQVITVTASARAGYAFCGWSVAGGSTLSNSAAATTSLTVYNNFTLTAGFTLIPFTLTAGASPAGWGTVAVTPSQASYTPSTVVTISATANPGYSFVSWTATGGTVGNTLSTTTTLSINSNCTLTAGFSQNSYIGTETAANGTIILSNSGPYIYGQVITVTASAQVGYVFGGWSVTGGSTLTNSAAVSSSLTVYNNFTLTASFTPIPYTLTVSASPSAGGTVTVTLSQATYNYNNVVTITAAANPGYTFSGWTATGGTVALPGSAATSLTITDNVTLTAVFSQNSYSGTDTVTDGTIIVSDSGPYVYGQVITVTASAQVGYLFNGWSLSGSCALGDTSAAATTLTVYGDFTLTANFAAIPYTVTTQASPAGTGRAIVTPSQATYYYGDTVTIQGSASPGDAFTGWTVTGGTVAEATAATTTLTVLGDVTLTAGFSNPVLVTIDASSVTWDDTAGLMTVQVYFARANGNTGLVTDIAAELYLTGADSGSFTADSSDLNGLDAHALAGLISGTLAWAAWDDYSFTMGSTDPVGVSFYFDDVSGKHAVDITTIAPGTVVAIYYFNYIGNHADFTQVQAHLCNWGVNDDTWPGVIDLASGGSLSIAASNNGVNLAAGTFSIMAATSSTWVYQNTTGTTQDRHVVALTVSVTADTWGNQSYTTTVTQTGPGVVTPTQSWTSGTLVTPAATASWVVPVGGKLSGYLVGGRVNGAVNSAGNMALTGSCTVTVSMAGNVGGTATATVVITVRPLGGIDGNGPASANDLKILDNCLNGLATDSAGDLTGDGVVTTADRVMLNMILNGLATP